MHHQDSTTTTTSSPVIGLSCWERPLDTTLADRERHHLLSATYTAAITDAGGIAVLLPSLDPVHAAAVLGRVDGLVVTGGGDIHPRRYGAENTDSTDIDEVRDDWELALLHEARRSSLPLLGVCRGVQVLNVGMGGTLSQHVWGSSDHTDLWNDDRTRLETGHHDVVLTGVAAEVYGTDCRRVNSLHHQSIDRVGDGLAVVATAPDGCIEAVATTGEWPAFGVQWHPERMIEDGGPFRWLVEHARRRQRVVKTRPPSDADTLIVSPSP